MRARDDPTINAVVMLLCIFFGQPAIRALARMLESDERRRSMGDAGQRRVEALFSLPRQVAEVAAAFRCAMVWPAPGPPRAGDAT